MSRLMTMVGGSSNTMLNEKGGGSYLSDAGDGEYKTISLIMFADGMNLNIKIQSYCSGFLK